MSNFFQTIRNKLIGAEKRFSHGSPSFAWSIILWTFAIAMIGGAYLAYSSYQWVVAPVSVSVRPDKIVTISNEEILQILQTYSAKQAEYQRLKNGGPITAPSMLLGVSNVPVIPPSTLPVAQ